MQSQKANIQKLNILLKILIAEIAVYTICLLAKGEEK